MATRHARRPVHAWWGLAAVGVDGVGVDGVRVDGVRVDDVRVDGVRVDGVRVAGLVAAAAVVVAGVALAGCGAGAPGHQSVAVGPASTVARTTGPRPTVPRPVAHRPAAHRPTGPRPIVPAPSAPVGLVSGARCRPSQLRADQLPVSSGTGRSYLAWSLTNIGPATCRLAGGQPTLAFVDASGASIIGYGVSHLPTAAGVAVTVAPGHAAWVLTEESAVACGTGTTVAGGPFHYVVRLPGGAGSVPWTASYLSGSTLSDFCRSVSLAVGNLQATRPTG